MAQASAPALLWVSVLWCVLSLPIFLNCQRIKKGWIREKDRRIFLSSRFVSDFFNHLATSKVEISADFFNLFNHVNFFDPSLNISSPETFGVISSELIPANRTPGSRWIELGLRVSF